MSRLTRVERPYEPPRRCHTIMSREDYESGKESRWTELEIRGPIKNLSPNLWTFNTVTALFLNDNSLQRIPADIVLMTSLVHLDLSGNKLRSLPAELGDMTHLRELLLNNNSLRVLPYELGKLFLLQRLGILGNPLQPDILSMVNEVNGTAKLLSFLLDNLAIGPRAPNREWISVSQQKSRHGVNFIVMSYNVLCEKYATRQMYGYCPSWALLWEYRKHIILKEILDSNADIVALQEVETDQYHTYFYPKLSRFGYDGIFSPKSRAKTMDEHDRKFVDGCAIFFNKARFHLLEQYLIEFNQLAAAHSSGSEAMLNRVMLRDNIGIAVLLELKDSAPQLHGPAHHLLVSNAHIHWDPEFRDVKLIQTVMLMEELEAIAKSVQSERGIGYKTLVPGMPGVPVLVCGDLNSLPDSGVVDFLVDGQVNIDHPDLQGLSYDGFLARFSESVWPLMGEKSAVNKPKLMHRFALKSTYSDYQMPFTNYTYDFKGVIDYIFYSSDFLNSLGLLGPISMDWIRDCKVVGCPNPHIPSDHFPLMCEFELLL